MKSKYYLTFFACLVLITTTIVNVSIYKKNLRVYGQVPTKPGSFCTVNGAFKCEQYLSMAISFKCVNHQWSFYQHCPSNRCNLSNTACESVTLPTPTTVGNTYPPTSTPRPVYPTPTGAGATNPPPPTLGYIPCFEIERVYTQYCRSQPTSTPIPTALPTRVRPTSFPTSATSTPKPSPTSAQQCSPNSKRCISQKLFQICTNYGFWSPSSGLSCPVDQICVNGDCVIPR